MGVKDKKQKIFDEAVKRGYTVTVRNIAYALMRVYFKDPLAAYTVIMGGAPDKDTDVDVYDSMPQVQFLIEWIGNDIKPKKRKSEAQEILESKNAETQDDGNISQAENRAGIETQIAEILALKSQLLDADGKVTDVKTMALLQKTEMDARSRLNDKFGGNDDRSSERIAVLTRFNHICEWTGRECFLQTKDCAKENWHLIDDPNYKTEEDEQEED